MYIFKKKWVQILLILIALLILGWSQMLSTFYIVSAHFQCTSQSAEVNICNITPTEITIPQNKPESTNQTWQNISFYLPDNENFSIKRNESSLTLERTSSENRRSVITISSGYNYQFLKAMDTMDIDTLEISSGEVGYFEQKANGSVANLIAQDPSHYEFLTRVFESSHSPNNYFMSSNKKFETATLLQEKLRQAYGQDTVRSFRTDYIQGYVSHATDISDFWNVYVFSNGNPQTKSSLLLANITEEELFAILSSFQYTN